MGAGNLRDWQKRIVDVTGQQCSALYSAYADSFEELPGANFINVNAVRRYFWSKIVGGIFHIPESWGRCYDHNFLRFFPIFGQKIAVLFKNQCYDQNFAYFSFVLKSKTPIFLLNFLAKIF
jgi:hypothetical protein